MIFGSERTYPEQRRRAQLVAAAIEVIAERAGTSKGVLLALAGRPDIDLDLRAREISTTVDLATRRNP